MVVSGSLASCRVSPCSMSALLVSIVVSGSVPVIFST